MNDEVKVPEEQIRYANLLFWGAWAGIAIMVVTYFIYVTGIFEPHIPLNEVSNAWGMRVTDYVEKYDIPLGWGWVGMVGKGDFLNFIGVALLAGMTVVCFIVLIPTYVGRKDWPLTGIVIAEIVVLVVAASGIFGSGGH